MVQQAIFHLKDTGAVGSDPNAIGCFLTRIQSLSAAVIRMRVEGRGASRGRRPDWLRLASDVRLTSYRNGGATAVAEFSAPTLWQAAPELYEQREIWDTKPDRDDTAFDVISDAVRLVRERSDDTDRLDRSVLEAIGKLGAVLKDGCLAIALVSRRYRGDQVPLIDASVPRAAVDMRKLTPADQACRVVGVLDMIRASTQRFDIQLDDGQRLAGIYVADQDLVDVRHLVGQRVVASGMAVFRSSGRPLRIDADRLDLAGDSEPALWSRLPRPRAIALDRRDLVVRQGPRSGVAATIGRWPGDETDGEIEAALAELRE